MDLGYYTAEVIGVSSSGVLAPGPLFFSNLLLTLKKSRYDGFRVAAGHAMVEVPLVIALSAGLFSIHLLEPSSHWIALSGGIAILGFAGQQTFSVLKSAKGSMNTTNQSGAASVGLLAKCKIFSLSKNQNPIAIGALLSGLNPFFLLWWFTVGLKLIFDSQQFGMAPGVALLLSFHIWMDFAWLGATGFLFSKASSLYARSNKIQLILTLCATAIMIAYGVTFVLSSLAEA